MRRAYKFLLRPTSRQVNALRAMLDDHRDLYNAALQERRDAYRIHGVSISFTDQSAQLSDIRRADPGGQERWSFNSQQATLRRLNRAFEAFFRRVKTGQRPGFPRFKSVDRFDTVEWPRDRDGCRWDSTLNGSTRVYLQGVGHVRVHQHRTVVGSIKTLSVKREGNRWYLALSCDDVPVEPLQTTGAVAGIDMGIASFLTTSEGRHVPNPRYAAAAARRIAAMQQVLASCPLGDPRRRKVRSRLGALHRKVARQRLDHAHKIALDLVRDHDVICHEDLRIVSMTRSASGTAEAHGRNVAQKAGLNRSILDAGWGCFLRILASKAEGAGRVVIAVNPANTSRTCPSCGHCCAENRITQASFTCVACGYTAHADVVGALNVLRAGLVRRSVATAA